MALFKVKVRYILESEGIVEGDSQDVVRSEVEGQVESLPVVSIPINWYAQKDVYGDEANRRLELTEIISLIES